MAKVKPAHEKINGRRELTVTMVVTAPGAQWSRLSHG